MHVFSLTLGLQKLSRWEINELDEIYPVLMAEASNMRPWTQKVKSLNFMLEVTYCTECITRVPKGPAKCTVSLTFFHFLALSFVLIKQFEK